jgi:TfoX/Sxy family transcriptional regulator of competence genes
MPGRLSNSGRSPTARLVVRRVRDRSREQGELFPVWRYHAFFTDTALSTVDADLTHRAHAVVETVFSDLIDGPLAHLPSGRFPANAAWLLCAGISHNLMRAAGCLTGRFHAKARGATLRRHLVLVPARLARPQGRPTLHLPAYWPWQQAATRLHTLALSPLRTAVSSRRIRRARPETEVERLGRPAGQSRAPSRAEIIHLGRSSSRDHYPFGRWIQA